MTDQYSTADPNRAAFLLTRGCRLLRTTAAENDRLNFVFSNADGRADKAVLDLVNNAAVGAIDFIGALRSIKAIIHTAKGGR